MTHPPIILPYQGIMPTIHPDAFIAPGAVVVGDVHIGKESNVWFGCVIRGDVNTIRIGERTNIQDGTVIHVTSKTGPTKIGSGITIGHSVLLHACTLEDGCFVGMHATVMDGAVVETGGMVAAGALVTYNKRIATGQLWAGNPAKYFRDLKQEEQEFIPISAQNYVTLAKAYR
jgi:carbonic anhydrase/acetyltransferase-like protein (isoleucine patch superfamily)